jgi:hypothetical protein
MLKGKYHDHSHCRRDSLSSGNDDGYDQLGDLLVRLFTLAAQRDGQAARHALAHGRSDVVLGQRAEKYEALARFALDELPIRHEPAEEVA